MKSTLLLSILAFALIGCGENKPPKFSKGEEALLYPGNKKVLILTRYFDGDYKIAIPTDNDENFESKIVKEAMLTKIETEPSSIEILLMAAAQSKGIPIHVMKFRFGDDVLIRPDNIPGVVTVPDESRIEKLPEGNYYTVRYMENGAYATITVSEQELTKSTETVVAEIE